MKIKIQGEWSLMQAEQAIFEQIHEIEDRFYVHHVKDITIFMTTTNGSGSEVRCLDESGKEITVLYSSGPYQSAADHYQI